MERLGDRGDGGLVVVVERGKGVPRRSLEKEGERERVLVSVSS